MPRESPEQKAKVAAGWVATDESGLMESYGVLNTAKDSAPVAVTEPGAPSKTIHVPVMQILILRRSRCLDRCPFTLDSASI